MALFLPFQSRGKAIFIAETAAKRNRPIFAKQALGRESLEGWVAWNAYPGSARHGLVLNGLALKFSETKCTGKLPANASHCHPPTPGASSLSSRIVCRGESDLDA